VIQPIFAHDGSFDAFWALISKSEHLSVRGEEFGFYLPQDEPSGPPCINPLESAEDRLARLLWAVERDRFDWGWPVLGAIILTLILLMVPR
jgi:hypothetical protein